MTANKAGAAEEAAADMIEAEGATVPPMGAHVAVGAGAEVSGTAQREEGATLWPCKALLGEWSCSELLQQKVMGSVEKVLLSRRFCLFECLA